MLSFSRARHILKQCSRQINFQRGLSSGGSAQRVAIVTGAARGIGRAIALRLANDGFDVAINDLHSAESRLQEVSNLISQSGRRATVCPGNASVETDVKEIVHRTVQQLGSVDVMVANAGICILKPFTETTVDDWDKIFKVNARGVFLCYKYAAEQMLKQGRGGRIIGASSVTGKKGFPLGSAYSASKFAVRGLTQAIAQELGPHGITVNAYAPGVIETDMLKSATGIIDTTTPMGVLGFNGSPDDIAGLVSYLSSNKARFVTGQSISIDGGVAFD